MHRSESFIRGVSLVHFFVSVFGSWLHLEAVLIALIIPIVVSFFLFTRMLILFLFSFKRVWCLQWSVFITLSFIVGDFLLSLFFVALLLLTFLFFLLEQLLLLRRLDLVDRSDEGSNLSLRL